MVEATAVDRETFETLNRYVGPRTLGENIGADEEFVAKVLHGEAELGGGHIDAMYELLEVVQQAVGEDAGGDCIGWGCGGCGGGR